jgi:hypothetical protein
MRSADYAGFAAAALAGASFSVGIEATDAQAKPRLASHNHDGIYAVRLATQHGSCHALYNTKITVNDGQVHATGHALLRASGHIGQGGAVSVTLRLLHHAAQFRGLMRGHSGSGKWSSASLACRGYWRATRQS